ncbi:hypothetical protein F4814DRAFT_409307 [Daldinia grandis]|nr:hypothetical protein F4814DRAFT_409307 [Daldinia grandis]
MIIHPHEWNEWSIKTFALCIFVCIRLRSSCCAQGVGLKSYSTISMQSQWSTYWSTDHRLRVPRNQIVEHCDLQLDP